MSRHPTVKWAQRSDKVYLTIELPDAEDVKLELEPEGRFVFNATRDGVPYESDIELFDKISVKESKSDIGARNIVCVVKKAEKKWWSRLLKQEGKPPAFLKVDWDKWIDEDGENESADSDYNGTNSLKNKKKNKRKQQPSKKNGLKQLASKLKLNCICKT